MAIIKCPCCQSKINISATASGGYPKRPAPDTTTLHSSQHSPFKNDAVAIAPVAPGYEVRNESATFLPTREAHVYVPLLRSLITGCYWGVIGGSVITLLNMQGVWGRVGAWGSLGYGVVWGSLLFVGTSFFYWITITGKYDGLLSRVETYTGVDIDGDGEVGQPEPRTIQVEVDNGKSKQWEELPGDEAALIEFAKSIISGRVTFSEDGAAATGYGVTNFRKLRDKFFKHHWAEWKDPKARNQGITLYRAGRTVLSRIAETEVNAEVEAGMSNQFVEKGTGKGSWG